MNIHSEKCLKTRKQMSSEGYHNSKPHYLGAQIKTWRGGDLRYICDTGSHIGLKVLPKRQNSEN